ncbi:hypothetical protein [uncultured Mediterranean phage]|nr:hypothetical protein [uncultured Mediterranean phage]
MPYINAQLRPGIWNRNLGTITSRFIHTTGDLNYAITVLLDDFLVRQVSAGKKVGYTEMSAARAALTDAADEFYSVVMRPYEERQRQNNGDVYKFQPGR